MVDRLEMANQYVREMLEKRDDIVGAFVVGSVARGDATETSDIDLGLIVEGQEGDEIMRGGADAWRDGVYIEVGLEAKNRYADSNRVLNDRVAATHMNDALILFDPTGHYARIQKEVRARFMEPRWLGARVHHQLSLLRYVLTGLRDAVSEGDPLAICWNATGVALWVPAVTLLINGITPSSTRGLLQVEMISPELKERICEWEGSTQMSLDEVNALMPLISQCLTLQQAAGSEQWGRAYGYFENKAKWHAAKGSRRMALHLMIFLPAGMADAAQKSEDPATISRERDLARRWLQAVGWEVQKVLEEKVCMAKEMVAEVEAMAARLPSGEDSRIPSRPASLRPAKET